MRIFTFSLWGGFFFWMKMEREGGLWLCVCLVRFVCMMQWDVRVNVID